MSAFEDLHQDRVTGSLAMFDRMTFKGRLTGLYKPLHGSGTAGSANTPN
jgi:hypothetical protein